MFNSDNKQFYYDFTIPNKRKIIEFDGTYWHCDPRKYNSDYFHKLIKMTSQQIWDYDNYKTNLAKENGYEVLHVLELDYKKDPKRVLQKCIDFINEKITG